MRRRTWCTVGTEPSGTKSIPVANASPPCHRRRCGRDRRRRAVLRPRRPPRPAGEFRDGSSVLSCNPLGSLSRATRRPLSKRRRTSGTSSSRPTSLIVGLAGGSDCRSPYGSGSRRRDRRPRSGRCFPRRRCREACSPRLNRRPACPVESAVGGPRDQDLAAVSGGHHPCTTVQRRTEVVAVAFHRLAGVDAHSPVPECGRPRTRAGRAGSFGH